MNLDKQNSRRHSDRNKAAIRKSLETAKAARSIVIDSGDNVLAGNGVAEQWEAMGGKVRVVETSGDELVAVKRVDVAPDSPQARQIATLDNLVADTSAYEYDMERLRAHLANDPVSKAIAEQDERLRKLLKVAKPESVDAGELVDKAAQLQEKWQVKRGDLWQCGKHRILCGDSTNAEDVARVMQGEKAVVFTDAPYGVSIVAKNGKIGAENLAKNQVYAPVANDDTTQTARDFYNLCVKLAYSDFILWGGNYFTDFLPPRACWIIWDKREGMASNNFADCEIAWTSFDLPARVYHHLWNGMIRKGDDGKKQHPTQKPVELHVDILNDFAKQDAIIFDGFLGSGTTLIAAEQTGRIGRGIEIEPKYVAVSLERLSNLGLECKRIE